jgi:hypothetical protein
MSEIKDYLPDWFLMIRRFLLRHPPVICPLLSTPRLCRLQRSRSHASALGVSPRPDLTIKYSSSLWSDGTRNIPPGVQLPASQKRVDSGRTIRKLLLRQNYWRQLSSSGRCFRSFAASRRELSRSERRYIRIRPARWYHCTRQINPWRKDLLKRCIISREPLPPSRCLTVLNVMELSSLWHLPGVYTKLPNVAWSVSASFPKLLKIYLSLTGKPKIKKWRLTTK